MNWLCALGWHSWERIATNHYKRSTSRVYQCNYCFRMKVKR